MFPYFSSVKLLALNFTHRTLELFPLVSENESKVEARVVHGSQGPRLLTQVRLVTSFFLRPTGPAELGETVIQCQGRLYRVGEQITGIIELRLLLIL